MSSLVLAPATEAHWTEECRAAGAATLLDEIERFVRAAVARLPPDPAEAARAGSGRPRVLPVLARWAGLLVGVLRGYLSQQALRRLRSGAGLWDDSRFPATDQAVRDRLAAGGTADLMRPFRQLNAALAERARRCARRGDSALACTLVETSPGRHLRSASSPRCRRRSRGGRARTPTRSRRRRWSRTCPASPPVASTRCPPSSSGGAPGAGSTPARAPSSWPPSSRPPPWPRARRVASPGAHCR